MSIRAKRTRVLVTGGPTRAYLDKVRYLSNFSSGELAYRLCRHLSRRGMEVALVSGPASQPWDKLSLARWKPVETADEMHKAVMGLCRSFRPHYGVFAAAVLDFVPARQESGKVSSRGSWNVKLKPTKKIIDDVGKHYPRVKRIGFKLEWDRMGKKEREAFMRENLRRKKLDALCLNFLSEVTESGHRAYLLDADGKFGEAATKGEIVSWIGKWIEAQVR